MKRYHECATIKDGNKRVAFYVQDTHGIDTVTNPNSVNTPWVLLTVDEFENLVKENKVQYLVYDNGGVKCRYTDEEKQSLIKVSSREFIEETEKEYFNRDCIFSFKHVNAANKNNLPVVACCAGQITKIFGKDLIMLIFCGLDYKIEQLYKELYCIVPSFGNLMNYGGNTLRVLLPVDEIENIFNATNIKALFNTSTLKFTQNETLIKPKKLVNKLIQKKPSSEIVNETIKLLDKITNKILSTYNI